VSLSRMAAVAAGFIVGLFQASPPRPPRPCGKVSSPTAQVYLFGTLHALGRDGVAHAGL